MQSYIGDHNKKSQKQILTQALILSTNKMSAQGKVCFLAGYISSGVGILPNNPNVNSLITIINGLQDYSSSQLISNTNVIEVFLQASQSTKRIKNNTPPDQLMSKFQTYIQQLSGQVIQNRNYIRQKWAKEKKLQSETESMIKVEQQKSIQSTSMEHQSLRLIRLMQEEDEKQEKLRRLRQKQEEVRFNQFLKQEKLKQQENRKNRMQRETKVINCQICAEDIPYNDIGSLNCGHIFHRGCIRSHIEALVNEKKVDIPCPLGCGGMLTVDDVEEFIDGELKQKFNKFCFDVYIQKNDKSTSWCPTAGCTAAFSFEEALDNYRCPVCKKHYCLKCRCEYHKDQTCAEYRISKNYSEDDKKFEEFVAGSKFKQCPKCKFWVDRIQGCSTMTCRCGHQFCYDCGGSDCPHGACKNLPGGGGVIGGFFGGRRGGRRR